MTLHPRSAALAPVQKAIANLHRSGIATTHLIDGTLVTMHPEGSVAPVKGPR